MGPVIAKLLSTSEFYIVPGKLKVRELWFEVPLDHSKPDGKRITLFARSAVPHEKPIVEPKEPQQRPFLVYLQGGPGFGNPAPQDSPLSKYMLDRGYELLLLDYRGTGLSSTVSADTLAAVGGPQEQADYLKHFRADTIVRDLEAVRRCLTKDFPPEKQKWSIFGQSFGGMTSMTYLSFAPEGLRESFITGGLAALDKGPADIYPATYKTLITRNKAYYKKFPGDVATIKQIAAKIEELGGARGIPLPAGGLLTVKLLMLLGIAFGGDGGIDKVHNIMVRMKADLDQAGLFTRATLNIIEQDISIDEAPIYMLLHEPCWIPGPGIAADFAADRVGQALPEYQWLHDDWAGVSTLARDEPLYFLGEMMPRFRLETCAELMRLKDTVEILARFDQWPALYDLEQLGRNDVPVYAACYNDMYVDSDMARVTASRIRGIKVFETNVLFHGAIRTKPEEVFRELLRLRDDTID
ncbi:Alpha/Beta hydrolase protein [Microdochium bolleyi]|uniref:Alpha/Beta hydrolase protein n=1 Tax=Microdochium bolleyi TaxID=196109 RepID=A0A136JEP1_9PEZI|nr:Alpha/Beta hydrolase protein [Microdochium bolleyi]